MEKALQHVLLTPAQMAVADRMAIASGVPGQALMAAAGQAVADAIRARWTLRPTVVLCGPGNNGGDGFIAASALRQLGWPVQVALWGEPDALHGDAAWAAKVWGGKPERATPQVLDGAELIVDALLGAGLSRPLEDPLGALVEAVNAAPAQVCAVDVPTGIDGATGAVCGRAVQADLTVTFFRRKPGHVLLPGRVACGATVCADIGIRSDVLPSIGSQCWVNHPDLWLDKFPWPHLADHKYRRGHALVIGGGTMLGAARLACLAAARCAAGLVTLAVPGKAWPIQAAALTSVLVEALPADGDVGPALADPRRNALLIGPGLGHGAEGQGQVLALLRTGRPCVLDADALTLFAQEPAVLEQALHAACVLTPHEGEFARLFQISGDKLLRAGEAARRTGAVIVLKGADTVIAAARGACVINENAPATLATAGAGDVLAGMITGLLAAGMPAFDAAGAAVWLHGEAAALAGPGLLAEDLPEYLPQALAGLARLRGG